MSAAVEFVMAALVVKEVVDHDEQEWVPPVHQQSGGGRQVR
jgi:hypothetical protein